MKANQKKQLTPTQQRVEQFLMPIIEATGGYGDKKQLANQLSEATGEPVSRHTIERWLHKDPERRQEPHLGNGLMLRDVFEANKNKPTKRKEQNRNGKTRQTKQGRSGGACKAN